MRLYKHLHDEIAFVDDDFFLTEAIINVDVESYLKPLKDWEIETEINQCEDTSCFISILNRIYNKKNIYFYIKPNSKYSGKTLKSGKINIFLGINSLLLYNTKKDKFIEKIKIILEHELIHREQSKKINWDNYHIKHPVNKTEYLANKQEIMAYAKSIVDQLHKKFIVNKKILDFLQSPTKGESNYLDQYIENFGNDDKAIKRLYKYMYEYLIKDE